MVSIPENIPTSRIVSIDLLTVAQFNQYKNITIQIDDETTAPLISELGSDWWLSNAGSMTRYVYVVHKDKAMTYSGTVNNGNMKVRPIINFNGSTIYGTYGTEVVKQGSIISFGGTEWIVLAPTIALSKSGIGCCAFNLDWKDLNAQKYTQIPLPTTPVTYKNSTVKDFVDNWLLYWK